MPRFWVDDDVAQLIAEAGRLFNLQCLTTAVAGRMPLDNVLLPRPPQRSTSTAHAQHFAPPLRPGSLVPPAAGRTPSCPGRALGLQPSALDDRAFSHGGHHGAFGACDDDDGFADVDAHPEEEDAFSGPAPLPRNACDVARLLTEAVTAPFPLRPPSPVFAHAAPAASQGAAVAGASASSSSSTASQAAPGAGTRPTRTSFASEDAPAGPAAAAAATVACCNDLAWRIARLALTPDALEQLDESGWTPLMHAAHAGSAPAAALLLAARASMSVRTKHG